MLRPRSRLTGAWPSLDGLARSGRLYLPLGRRVLGVAGLAPIPVMAEEARIPAGGMSSRKKSPAGQLPQSRYRTSFCRSQPAGDGCQSTGITSCHDSPAGQLPQGRGGLCLCRSQPAGDACRASMKKAALAAFFKVLSAQELCDVPSKGSLSSRRSRLVSTNTSGPSLTATATGRSRGTCTGLGSAAMAA